MDRDLADLVASLPVGQRAEFDQLLRAVENPVANLLLTGTPTRFSRLSPSARERYLLGWSHSRLAVKRRGFQAAKRLAMYLYYARPLDGRSHPLWSRIGYAPPALPAPPSALLEGVGPVVPEGDLDLEADVCIVGSGAGGSVIAARLAAVGYRVVVLEAGPWMPGLAYPRIEKEATDRLWLGRGIVTTRDTAIAFLAGESAGGGTAINWMTCLRPIGEARREWEAAGMAGAASGPLDLALDRVSERLGVTTAESQLNPANDALRRGCVALGYAEGPDYSVIPRNARACAERCGFCTFGCPYGAKQSTVLTFLADALRAGTRLCCNTRAEQIEIEGGRARAVRAVYRFEDRHHAVRIRARAVVVAGGALQTPTLLQRSGLSARGIGAGLRIDPTVALVGEFDRPITPWVGPLQTIRVHRFQMTDSGGHGPFLEIAPAHPGLSALALPWEGAAEHRRLLERAAYCTSPIALVRDVGEGRVDAGSDGRPVITYRLTRDDRRNLVRGLVETARILSAAGARRIVTLHAPPIVAGDGSAPLRPAQVDTFVDEVTRVGIRENQIMVFSAHPMGAARIGPNPQTSAARPSGEVHGVENLWIGDGSLLPSAPGVNPMLSIMAVAWRTADELLSRLSGSAVSEGAGRAKG